MARPGGLLLIAVTPRWDPACSGLRRLVRWELRVEEVMRDKDVRKKLLRATQVNPEVGRDHEAQTLLHGTAGVKLEKMLSERMSPKGQIPCDYLYMKCPQAQPWREKVDEWLPGPEGNRILGLTANENSFFGGWWK